MEKRRIGILTSGGDCPGLNAVLRGAERAATALDWEVVGFRNGFEGLLPPGDYVMLDRAKTSGIMTLGGTILGTTNKGHFISKTGAGRKSRILPETLGAARKLLQTLRVEGLIVIGGDGSQATALQLFNEGIPTVGVPKTIDNDLEATAMTFGFDSAVQCVVESLDRLRTTAASHGRVMVVEVMGRHAGWIALHGGFAGDADVILLPEIPFEFEKVAQAILAKHESGSAGTLIVVAEGAHSKGTRSTFHMTQSGEFRMGGIGDIVAREIALITGRETRSCVLGHLQRGGAPTPLDRLLGTQFGVKAVDLIRQKKYGRMVSCQNYKVGDVALADAVNKLRLVSPHHQMVHAARTVEISFGD